MPQLRAEQFRRRANDSPGCNARSGRCANRQNDGPRIQLASNAGDFRTYSPGVPAAMRVESEPISDSRDSRELEGIFQVPSFAMRHKSRTCLSIAIWGQILLCWLVLFRFVLFRLVPRRLVLFCSPEAFKFWFCGKPLWKFLFIVSQPRTNQVSMDKGKSESRHFLLGSLRAPPLFGHAIRRDHHARSVVTYTAVDENLLAGICSDQRDKVR